MHYNTIADHECATCQSLCLMIYGLFLYLSFIAIRCDGYVLHLQMMLITFLEVYH